MKRASMIAACLLAVCACAPAAPAAETLFVAQYPATPAWKKITDKHNAVQVLIEWIPADQNEVGIKDILTQQAFYNLKGQDPTLLVTNIIRGAGNTCASARISGPTPETENGYKVVYAQVYCVNASGVDADMFIKAIGGNEAVYVVQREFRRPTTPGAKAGVSSFKANQVKEMQARLEAQKLANDFLVKGVQLCPLATGRGACPVR